MKNPKKSLFYELKSVYRTIFNFLLRNIVGEQNSYNGYIYNGIFIKYIRGQIMIETTCFFRK